MIFTSIARDDLPVLRDLLVRHEIPIVLANRRLKLDTDFVGIDNEAGASTMVEHLLSLGYRRIGFISGPPLRRQAPLVCAVIAWPWARRFASMDPAPQAT